jgi:hypothetical protein
MDLLLWKKIKYKINNVCSVNKVVVDAETFQGGKFGRGLREI